MELRETLNERNQVYGSSWLISGSVLKLLHDNGFTSIIMSSEYSHNWLLILSKLIRLLKTPNHYDTWLDIAGYATLVCEHLKLKEQTTE